MRRHKGRGRPTQLESAARGSVWLAKHQRHPDGNWYLCWYDRGADQVRWRSTGTRDPRQAEDARTRKLIDLQSLPSEADPETVLVATALEFYLTNHLAGKAALEPALSEAGYILERLGALTVAELGRSEDRRIDGSEVRIFNAPQTDFVAWLKARAPAGRPNDRLSDAYINRILSTLRAALNFSVEKNVLKSVPSIPALPATRQRRHRWLTPEEFAKLRAAADEDYLRLYLDLAIATLARPGALFALLWDQIDFEGGFIDLGWEGEVDGKKFKPILPLLPHLREELTWFRGEAGTAFVLERDGLPLNSIKKSFRDAVANAELARPSEITPYTLRHTGATWMARRGVSLWEIAGYMGHKDTRMVERFYAKHCPDRMKAAAAALTWELAVDGPQDSELITLSIDKAALAALPPAVRSAIGLAG